MAWSHNEENGLIQTKIELNMCGLNMHCSMKCIKSKNRWKKLKYGHCMKKLCSLQIYGAKANGFVQVIYESYSHTQTLSFSLPHNE